MSAGGGDRLRRTPFERVAAWLVTGPLGHLLAFAGDVLALWSRGALARARQSSKR